MQYFSPWVMQKHNLIEMMKNCDAPKKRYVKGSYILEQDSPIHHLHFLLSGRVIVTVLHHDGQEKTLAIHEAGAFFGETAYFDGNPSITNARALEDSVIIRMGPQELNNLFRSNPDAIMEILNSLGEKIRLLTFQVEYLSFMNNEHKIVSLLLSLFRTQGLPCGPQGNCPCSGGLMLQNRITDQEISNLLGIRREIVTKKLRKLRDLELIGKHNRLLCCPDLAQLSEYLINETSD